MWVSGEGGNVGEWGGVGGGAMWMGGGREGRQEAKDNVHTHQMY